MKKEWQPVADTVTHAAQPLWEWSRIRRITNGLADFIEDEELRGRILVKLDQVDQFLRSCPKSGGAPGELYEPDSRTGGYPAGSRGLNARAHRGILLGAVARYGGACRARRLGWKTGTLHKCRTERQALVAVLKVPVGDCALYAGTRFRPLRPGDRPRPKKGDEGQLTWAWSE